MRVSFTHVGGGLTIGVPPPATTGGQSLPNSDQLADFEIAGADGKFLPADAKIDGTTVVVSNAAVAAPKAVRYAWAAFPEPLANLSSTRGRLAHFAVAPPICVTLLAYPFRGRAHRRRGTSENSGLTTKSVAHKSAHERVSCFSRPVRGRVRLAGTMAVPSPLRAKTIPPNIIIVDLDDIGTASFPPSRGASRPPT